MIDKWRENQSYFLPITASRYQTTYYFHELFSIYLLNNWPSTWWKYAVFFLSARQWTFLLKIRPFSQVKFLFPPNFAARITEKLHVVGFDHFPFNSNDIFSRVPFIAAIQKVLAMSMLDVFGPNELQATVDPMHVREKVNIISMKIAFQSWLMTRSGSGQVTPSST